MPHAGGIGSFARTGLGRNEGVRTHHPGQQRYIINYVDGVKSIQKRIDRAIMLIENLKTMPSGKFDYRHLLGMEERDD